jgi:acyl-coenzyme A synthetase/AMP-(fatty) acid ligase
MSQLILHTSGSTKEPKEIIHDWNFINDCIERSVREIGLTSNDTVLDVFPGNVIAHYTVTAMPAKKAGAKLISANFNAYTYCDLFNKYRPTYTSLIPRHIKILESTKGWKDLDMSCVRYMVVGSGQIPQNLIDNLRNKGVQLVANWYGMTEMPPPVFVGYNSESFDFTPKEGFNIEFTDAGECIVNGHYTGDLFDLKTKKFLRRTLESINENTWKTKP